MTHELKRPLLFNVQQTKRPVIGVVSQLELAKLDQRLELRAATVDGLRDDNDYDDGQQQQWLRSVDASGSPRRTASPSVALPLVRSPRPEKPVYIPSPSKTPQYFRWKRPAPPGHKTPSKPTALRPGPSAPSSRVSPWRDGNSSESARPSSLAAMSSGQNLRLAEQSDGDPFPMPTSSRIDVTLGESHAPSAWRQSSLFQYSDPLTSPPATPKSPHTSALADVSAPAVMIAATAASGGSTDPTSRGHMPQDASSSSVLFGKPVQSLIGARSETSSPAGHSTSVGGVAAAGPLELKPIDQQQQQHTHLTASPSPLSSMMMPPDSSADLHTHIKPVESRVSQATSTPTRQRSPSPELVVGETASSFDALSSPLVLQMPQHRAPQERAITQHVLRGAFLRKYLHANNITRKLKETEQLLRSAALNTGVSSRNTVAAAAATTTSKSQPLLLRASTKGSGIQLGASSGSDVESLNEPGLINASAPVLRRLSSIDKAINKTVKRIRRLSGMETQSEEQQQQPSHRHQQLVTTPAPHLGPKYTSLHAISENQPSKKQVAAAAATKRASFSPVNNIGDGNDVTDGDGDDDDDDDVLLGGGDVRVDPSSAHMLRICQHVTAKRAIKAFLHQEMSVMHLIELALRDDESMARHRASTPATNSASGVSVRSFPTNQSSSSSSAVSDTNSSSSGPRDGRVPIRSMNPDIVEAVAGYLTASDQRLTIDELFVAALEAERKKLWKRAILLTSACIEIDREFVQVVLLRARCCRHLGLWTQAIKDLGHAVMLRPDEPRLVLLRAFLFVKTSDLGSALADVNRALLLHPKSTDALLLRADIFHRQGSIAAALQDLTTVLNLDPSCWRAFYDRATIRIRAVEGDEQCLSYHWEHMKYEQLLVSIVEDYVNALRKGCKMVEVVETVGDLTVRLMEFTGDMNVLRQVVQSLAHLVQVLSTDHRGSFYVATSNKPSSANSSSGNALERAAGDAPLTAMERELLVAALHAQRGRLFVLFGDRASALAEFDHAVVSEYHYPVAHFYRGAFATLVSKDDGSDAAKSNNVQHLTRSIALDPTIAGAYTVRGALYLRDLKFNSALQDFKAAVTTDPTLYEVWLQIALIYLNHYHDCDACIRACASALTNDSCLARALYLRAEAYTRQGNTAAALRDYGRLTVAAPDDRWTHLLRGRLLLQLKLARPALYSFILFMEQGAAGGDRRAHLLCGLAFKILTRFRRAVDEFQRAVALSPTSENLVLLSESLHSMGDTENSLRVSEKVISADPGSFRGYVRRAQLLVSVAQFQLAMSEYDKALFLAPKEGRVYYERGIVQMQLYLRWRMAYQLNFDSTANTAAATAASFGQQPHDKRRKASPFEPKLSVVDVEMALGTDPMNDEATVRKSMKAFFAGSISDFCKCMRLEPLLADPYVDRAELYALGEEYDKAFRDFDAALERNPKLVRAHVNLGVLKCQFAAFASAIEDFDKAIKFDAKLPLVFFNRGVAYHKLSLWAQADRSYTKCIALSGTGRYIDAHRNRAIARCQLSDFAGALADFEEVRQSAPDDDQLHGGLGYVLLQLGRYEDAAKSFATYGRLSRDTFGDSGNAYFNLATQSAEHLDHATHRQHLTTALRFYVRAARIHPSNNDVRLNIANCLRKLGECARAITQCDTIHSAKPSHHHAALESKAFALYAMHDLDAAIECMSAAIRACIASSSSLGNIFYAFTNDSIHRNALECRTVTSRDGSGSACAPQSTSAALTTPNRNAVTTASPSPSPSAPPSSPMDTAANSVAMNNSTLERPVLPVSEIVVNGSSKQLLSLYMLNRGILYEKRGDWALARQNYRDAIYFDALSVHAQLCMGTLNLLDARFDDSIASFTHALALEPRSAVAHINVGVAYVCSHDLARALEHFDAALALAPTCSYAYANKAVALAQRGDTALAEHHLKRAIEELPSRPGYYLARGKLIAQQKRLQDAMIDFSTALFLGYEGKL